MFANTVEEAQAHAFEGTCPHCGTEYTNITPDVLEYEIGEDVEVVIKETCQNCSHSWILHFDASICQDNITIL